MNEQRWTTAIHEAGHAVAGLELGGRCDGIVIWAGDGGLAHVRDLHTDRDAFMVASGPAAEYLAPQYPAPKGEFVTPDEVAAAPLPEGPMSDFDWTCSVVDSAMPQGVMTDDQRLARWATSGHEHDPEAWAGRVRFAKHVAGKIVAENAAKILRLAERLYVAGRVSGDEIQTIINEGKQ